MKTSQKRRTQLPVLVKPRGPGQVVLETVVYLLNKLEKTFSGYNRFTPDRSINLARSLTTQLNLNPSYLYRRGDVITLLLEPSLAYRGTRRQKGRHYTPITGVGQLEYPDDTPSLLFYPPLHY